MKIRRFFVIPVVVLLVLCGVSFSYETEYTIETPYEYPITPDMEEWKEFESHVEMIEACQIPEDILDHLSTPALAETVINYPLLSDMLAWSDSDLGFQSVVSSFNGLEELLSRDDGVDCLLTASTMISNQNNLMDTTNYTDRNGIRCVSLIVDKTTNSNKASQKSGPVIERGEVRTPNGSNNIPYYKDLGYDDLSLIFEDVPFTETELNDLEQYYAVNYPNAVKVDPRNPSYNCHSYAWHSTSRNNRYWLLSIDPYVTDGSYINIYPDEVTSGDRITYWSDVITIEHSALVESVRNGQYYVTSKWDFMGVYSHRDDYCPYYTDKTFIAGYTRN